MIRTILIILSLSFVLASCTPPTNTYYLDAPYVEGLDETSEVRVLTEKIGTISRIEKMDNGRMLLTVELVLDDLDLFMLIDTTTEKKHIYLESSFDYERISYPGDTLRAVLGKYKWAN